MKLTYDILWFEDQFEQITPLLDRLCGFIEQRSLTPKITKRHSISEDELYHLSDKLEVYNPYDLVIFDLDMGSKSEDGVSIAKQLRTNIYTDMVFYSGSRPSDVRSRIYDEDIQGVFVVHRPSFNSDIEPIIEDHIKKISSVNGARGMLMSEWSQIEVAIRDKVRRKIEALPQEEMNLQQNKLKSRLTKKFQEKIDRIESLETPSEILSHPMDCEFSMVRRSANSFLNNNEYFSDGGQIDSIVQERNLLAHNPQVIDDEDGSVVITDPRGKERKYSTDEFYRVRSELLALQKIIDDF